MFVGNQRKITVYKDQLLEKLKEGLEKHRAALKKAKEDYALAVVDFLEGAVERAKAGDYEDLVFRLSEPSDNSKDFECAIAMIEMSVQDQIELDETTFEQWVLGRWGWQRNFEAVSNSLGGYLAKSLSGKASH